MIRFETSMGNIDIDLYADEAPLTVDNFLGYVTSGFFENTVFHRIIPGFVVQGGGMTADMKRKETQPPIQNEAHNGLKNLRGTLSMARTQDPHSATSQFFINLADNTPLDPSRGNDGYAVFGKVIAGMEVVDEMAQVETGTVGFHQDVPLEAVTVVKAVVIDD